MAAPTATRLRDALRDLLGAAAASLTAPPDRQFISAGPPALVGNCDLLAAYATPARAISLDQPSELPPTRAMPRVRLVTLNVELHRCVSTDANPDRDTLDAEGVSHATDGWALLAGLTYRLGALSGDSHYVWQTTSPAPTATLVDPLELIDPSGGFAGWRVGVTVAL